VFMDSVLPGPDVPGASPAWMEEPAGRRGADRRDDHRNRSTGQSLQAGLRTSEALPGRTLEGADPLCRAALRASRIFLGTHRELDGVRGLPGLVVQAKP